MRINTNVSALNAYRNLSETNSAVSSSMQKLSSGFRINRAADDAAGLGIANKMRADTRALSQASKNAEQANSVLQIAEGATGTIQKMLERMKELATQAGSDNTDADGRTRLDKEFKALQAEITRTVDTTKFQGKLLLNGGFGTSLDTDAASSTALAAGTGVYSAELNGAAAGTYTIDGSVDGELTITSGSLSETIAVTADGAQSVSFTKLGLTLKLDSNFTAAAGGTESSADATDIVVEAGANGGSFMVSSSGSYSSADLLTLTSMDLSLTTLGVGTNDITSSANAKTALTAIDTAIGKVNTVLGDIGATQNRIEYAQQNVKTTIQNFSAAESVIRDLDMAEEMTKFSKNNILAQAGTAMLAQANQSAQGVLQLLRG
jgi:flagellin